MNGLPDFTIADGRGIFRPSGSISLDGAIALIESAIAHARKLGLRQLLAETRNLTGHGPPNTFQRYYLMNRWLEAAAGQVQLALIVRPEMMDPQRFAIKVAENRGFVTNAFVAEEEAVAWLDSLALTRRAGDSNSGKPPSAIVREPGNSCPSPLAPHLSKLRASPPHTSR